MSDGDYQIETRRRSRSKTPFLRSSCDHEHCEHAGEEGHVHHQRGVKRKSGTNAPTVHTIAEETEVTSSSTSPTSKVQSKKSKIMLESTTTTTSSSGAAPAAASMSNATSSKAATATTTTSSSGGSISSKTTSTTTITKSVKVVGDSGGIIGDTSTPKFKATDGIGIGSFMRESYAAQFSNAGTESAAATGSRAGGGQGQRTKEVVQNEANSAYESRSRRMERSTRSNRTLNTSNPYVSATGGDASNGDINDHIAYKEYKRAGEYWNATPKTDYTYSELSPHRRELAPGVVAMPNMSRRSLEHHHERVNYMVDRNPVQEEFIRRRYAYQTYGEQRRDTQHLLYESGDDETDRAVHNKRYSEITRQPYNGGKYYAGESSETVSWFVRFITTIVTTVTSTWSRVTGGGDVGSDSYLYRRSHYYSEKQQRRGLLGTAWHRISSAFFGLFRYIYLIISSVQCLDIWLLQSSDAAGRNKKRFLLALLFLLPLLLFGGLYYYFNPNEPFPPKAFSELQFKLPPLPKINISEYIPNQERYEAIKLDAIERIDDLRTWTDDYFMYLKTVSQNVVDEARRYFQREQHFERV